MELFDAYSYKPEEIGDTERLLIREIGMNDIADYQYIVESCSGGVDPELVGLTQEEFIARHKAYIRFQYGFYGYGIWGLFLKASPEEMIGIAGVVNSDESGVGELSYAVLPDRRRQGYAYEACRFIAEYATGELIGFDSLIARIGRDNIPSQGLAAKLGIETVLY